MGEKIVIIAQTGTQPIITPRLAVGPQGIPAPELKIQYSSDSLSWHDDPVETDKYLSFSTDNGITWSDAIYFNNLSETLEWVEKARQWAENPENVEVETGQYSALHHAAQSAESANNAATSASNAATSESNAATSEANALASENKAKQWAENPEDIEVVAGQYSALHHKEKAIDAQIAAEAAQSAAATSEANAAVSESNAATSATNAATSETNALASENKAHQWAQEAEDIEVEPGEYSAYHWAKKAEALGNPVEDQIVDGVTGKAPSQNAVYDALASKTDKSTLTTKGDLYVRDATGITRLPIGSDGQILTVDSALASGIGWKSSSGAAQWQVFPIGVPIQVWDHLSGSVVPPNSGDVIYVRLTAGQSALGGYNYGNLSSESVTGSAPLVVATAVISLSTSPLYNKTIHLINTEQAFIRARTTSGTQQNDAFQGHRHFATTSSIIRSAVSSDSTRDVGPTDNGATLISQNDGTTAGAYGTPRLANETRPKNVSATFYLRIK